MFGNTLFSPLYKSCLKNVSPMSLLLYVILALPLALLTQHVSL